MADVGEMLNATCYVFSRGCQWQALPKALPPDSTVRDYFMGGTNGMLSVIVVHLRSLPSYCPKAEPIISFQGRPARPHGHGQPPGIGLVVGPLRPATSYWPCVAAMQAGPITPRQAGPPGRMANGQRKWSVRGWCVVVSPLAHPVEVDEGKARIAGQKSRLPWLPAAGSGVNSVPAQEMKWRAATDSDEHYVFAIALCGSLGNKLTGRTSKSL